MGMVGFLICDFVEGWRETALGNPAPERVPRLLNPGGKNIFWLSAARFALIKEQPYCRRHEEALLS